MKGFKMPKGFTSADKQNDAVRFYKLPIEIKRGTCFVFGVDGGLNTGIVLMQYDAGKPPMLRFAGKKTFWQALDMITAYRTGGESNFTSPRPVYMVIEDTNANTFIYGRHVDKAKGQAYLLKMAQDIGKNKAKTELTAEWAEQKGVEVIRMKPGTKKGKPTREQIYQLCGLDITNEHARDAAMLLIKFGVI